MTTAAKRSERTFRQIGGLADSSAPEQFEEVAKEMLREWPNAAHHNLSNIRRALALGGVAAFG